MTRTSVESIYEVNLPDTQKYKGRMPKLHHKTTASSEYQALSQVLQKHGCLFLYNELSQDIDKRVRKIIKEEKPGTEQLQLTLF